MINNQDAQLNLSSSNPADSGVAAEQPDQSSPAQQLSPQTFVPEQEHVTTEASAKLAFDSATASHTLMHQPDNTESHSGDESLAEIKMELSRLFELCSSFAARLEALEKVTDTTAKQFAFLPPQLRQMSSKIEGLNTSISEPRHHSVLLSVLGVYDLVDQVLRVLPQDSVAENAVEVNQRRDYEVFRTQLLQILHSNGLLEIPADGEFDPKYHRAVKRVAVTDQNMSNRVVELVRPGFRTENAVLRYAEVVVSHYAPSESNQQPETELS